MIDWERLGMAVLLTTIFIGVCGVFLALIIFLPCKVLFVLAGVAIVCMIISAFYKTLGDNSKNNKEDGTDKD